MITGLINVGLSGVFLVLPAPAAIRVDDAQGLGTLQPYGSVRSAVEPPPAGYRPVFVESLNRHGSRALTGPANIDAALELWQRASAERALTPRGERFGSDVRKLEAANEKLGYGNLSELGAEELRGIGARTEQRLPQLFSAAGTKVELVSSGAHRANQSAQNFAKGLRSEVPGLKVGTPVVDSRQLKFHRTDPVYGRFLHGDRPTREAIARVNDAPAVAQAAQDVLERIYTPDFVSRLADPVAEARSIYALYAIGPAMARESGVDFSGYLGTDSAAVFAHVSDARQFYQRGPGIRGNQEGFAPAAVVLDDFFSQIDARLAGGDTAAVFRFAHAEQVIPFAALLQLPGSDKQAAPDAPFTRANNPWRGAEVSRLAANIQWIVYDDAGRKPLVSMLYNERPIPFKTACAPIAAHSHLYALAELKNCLR